MPIHQATIQWYSADGTETTRCEVNITPTYLVVTYVYGIDHVEFRGGEEGAGHFRLQPSGLPGEATLHFFHDDIYLEGWWRVGNEECMWRITLDP